MFFINKLIFGRILFKNWDSFRDPSLQDSGFIIDGFLSEFIESLHYVLRQLNQKYHVYIQRFFVRECVFYFFILLRQCFMGIPDLKKKKKNRGFVLSKFPLTHPAGRNRSSRCLEPMTKALCGVFNAAALL